MYTSLLAQLFVLQIELGEPYPIEHLLLCLTLIYFRQELLKDEFDGVLANPLALHELLFVGVKLGPQILPILVLTLAVSH